ncbi:MAG: hypothetical protein IT317_11035 [Anaerolineales bacterium]|nr:hypothetical protein [Anaerolineales bacterium]
MLGITATEGWRAAHAGGCVGLLEMTGIENGGSSAALDARKREIEAEVRARYAGYARADFLTLPVMTAYDRYYTRFNKTYHVQLQLESIVLKGKRLPSVSPAVDANFMAEIETLVLTAGHDAAKLVAPVMIDTSGVGERMTQMNGEPKDIRAGDMLMRDADGIRCSIIYGQDARSPIAPSTTHALYVVYAPMGVPAESVAAQLEKIAAYVRLASPGAQVVQQRVVRAERTLATHE